MSLVAPASSLSSPLRQLRCSSDSQVQSHESGASAQENTPSNDGSIRNDCGTEKTPSSPSKRILTPKKPNRRLSKADSEAERSFTVDAGVEQPQKELTSDDEEAPQCCICLEEYTDDNPMFRGQCQHHFHLPCLMAWKQRSNACPMCCANTLRGVGELDLEPPPETRGPNMEAYDEILAARLHQRYVAQEQQRRKRALQQRQLQQQQHQLERLQQQQQHDASQSSSRPTVRVNMNGTTTVPVGRSLTVRPDGTYTLAADNVSASSTHTRKSAKSTRSTKTTSRSKKGQCCVM